MLCSLVWEKKKNKRNETIKKSDEKSNEFFIFSNRLIHCNYANGYDTNVYMVSLCHNPSDNKNGRTKTYSTNCSMNLHRVLNFAYSTCTFHLKIFYFLLIRFSKEISFAQRVSDELDGDCTIGAWSVEKWSTLADSSLNMWSLRKWSSARIKHLID